MTTASRPPATTVPPPISPRRIGLVFVGLLVLFALVAGRTVYLQAFQTRMLSNWAQGQQQFEQVLPAVRGDIKDRNGQEFAVGDERMTFFATPRFINVVEEGETHGVVQDEVDRTEDVEVAVTQIARILKLTSTEQNLLMGQLLDRDNGFVYVARKVPTHQADALQKMFEEQQIEGFGSYEEEQRLYPLQTVASQLVGFAGMDNEGLAGMEQLYDDALAGRPGRQVLVRDPAGHALDVLELEPEVDGRDVTLTIDSTLQAYTETVLTDTIKAFRAKGATAIVLNPRNGEILAMANVPRVNANNMAAMFQGCNLPTPPPRCNWLRNRAITDTYEPGSTFKVVTVSGALEDGVVTPTTMFDVPFSIQVADRRIKDSHAHGTERMTVNQILVESSNVGTIKIAQQMGRGHGTDENVSDNIERIDYWIRRFGFGAPTGIDFPGEVQGLMLAPEDWSGSTIGNVPIGQGIGVTALQLAAAYGAIANDGVMVQPHLLRDVEGEQVPQPSVRRVISERTARIMQTMFGGVVQDERGTGKLAAIPGYKVAGKTGTANIAENGVYVRGRYVASFVGFVPANNPQLVTLVVVNEPSVPWGGTVAAPAFERITEFALQYLAIPPDGNL